MLWLFKNLQTIKMQQRIDRNSPLDEGNIGRGGLGVNQKYAAKFGLWLTG
jgi:hypothetical protein